MMEKNQPKYMKPHPYALFDFYHAYPNKIKTLFSYKKIKCYMCYIGYSVICIFVIANTVGQCGS